jgi:hypothetical protein
MPKDATKNVDRYKVQGGHLNEFDFQQNQGQVKESGKPTKNATAKKLAAKKAGKKKAAKK